jgi:DNA-binding MarR family transcriptional regulator
MTGATITMDAGLRGQAVPADDRRDTGGEAFAGTPVCPDAQAQAGSDEDLALLARSIVAARRRLGSHLDATLFANPGMDILLFLFAEGLNGSTVTTNACCAAAGVPRTTALRWIKLLQDRGLVLGSDDISDRRVTMLALSEAGRTTIRNWLGEIVALPLRRQDSTHC